MPKAQQICFAMAGHKTSRQRSSEKTSHRCRVDAHEKLTCSREEGDGKTHHKMKRKGHLSYKIESRRAPRCKKKSKKQYFHSESRDPEGGGG